MVMQRVKQELGGWDDLTSKAFVVILVDENGNPIPGPTPGSNVAVTNFPFTAAQPLAVRFSDGTNFISGFPVTATDLDIRDLVFATDKVDASGSVVALDAPTLAALENINVTVLSGTVAATQSGTWTIDLSAASLAALESITVQNGAGAAAVNIQDGGNSITVDGTVGISGSVAVTGPLTDVQLRATPVPISGTVTITDGSGPVTVDGTVAATQSGVWTIALDAASLAALESITIQNGAGAAAVNIQDGGNSITVDGTVAVSNFPAVQPVSDNGGSLTVDDGGGSLTVDGAVTVSGTVGVSGTVTTADNKAEDAPHTTGDVGSFVLGVRNDVPAARTNADGDYSPLSVDVKGALYTKELNTLVPKEYDFIDLNYTGDDVTTVIYKTGGSGGTTVATLTLVYSAPGVLDTVTRT